MAEPKCPECKSLLRLSLSEEPIRCLDTKEGMPRQRSDGEPVRLERIALYCGNCGYTFSVR